MGISSVGIRSRSSTACLLDHQVNFDSASIYVCSSSCGVGISFRAKTRDMT